MQYTPQQMMGYKGYTHKTRIGNWNEDLELEEQKMRTFLENFERGTLPSQQMSRKFEHHLRPITLSPMDSKIRFGDKIMLFNEHTKGTMCIDLDTKLHHFQEKFGVFTNPGMLQPVARNVFTIEKVPSDDDVFYIKEGEEDFLHYGQTIRFKTCSDFYDKPLYLCSTKKTVTNFAAKSKQQEVQVDSNPSFNTIWKVEYIDPKFRFEYEGELVEPHVPVILRHCATNILLASDKLPILNDFGGEFEVYCHNHYDIHKMEKKENHWSIIMGQSTNQETSKDGSNESN